MGHRFPTGPQHRFRAERKALFAPSTGRGKLPRGGCGGGVSGTRIALAVTPSRTSPTRMPARRRRGDQAPFERFPLFSLGDSGRLVENRISEC